MARENCNVGAEEREEAVSNLDICVSPGSGDSGQQCDHAA